MKYLLSLILGFLFFLMPTSYVFAEELFSIHVNGVYKVNDEGITDTTLHFSITNLTEGYVSNGYVLKMRHVEPESFTVTEKGEPIDGSFKKIDQETTEIRLTFDKLAAGKGNSRVFDIHFSDKSFAKKTGDIWEVELPRFEDPTITSVSNSVYVPTSFGDEAYVTPNVQSKEIGDTREYLFHEISPVTPTKLGFGPFQTFSFTISYHLKNDEFTKKRMSVAIPPDTTTQRVYYESIVPKPSSITADPDGNWIASFDVSGKTTVDVETKGSVQLFSDARNALSKDPQYLLAMTKPSTYWQTNYEAIKTKAVELKTPRAIFDFVSTTLAYNKEKAVPGSARVGALAALQNPDNAICTEFSDLFIALARAAGIPSREINGFAYTNNPETEPLSLVSDVLHSWAEYWDSETHTWIPVDPTWSRTSRQDYFTKVDMRHFAFVIHGSSDSSPLPAGAYKTESDTKDVFVDFGETKISESTPIELSYNEHVFLNPFSGVATFKIQNTNGYSMEAEELHVFSDNSLLTSEFIPIIPAFGEYAKTVPIQYGFFGSKSPVEFRVRTTTDAKVFTTQKSYSVLLQTVYMFISLAILLGGIIFILFRPWLLKRSVWKKP